MLRESESAKANRAFNAEDDRGRLPPSSMRTLITCVERVEGFFEQVASLLTLVIKRN